jgi:four helix bundle protein
VITQKQNIIVDKTIHFSLEMIKYTEILNQQKKYVVANQLLRCATSIGANVVEAQNGESKSDFVHKIKLASKEAYETLYWLKLCELSEGFKFEFKFQKDLEEIIRILSKIIITSNIKSVKS